MCTGLRSYRVLMLFGASRFWTDRPLGDATLISTGDIPIHVTTRYLENSLWIFPSGGSRDMASLGHNDLILIFTSEALESFYNFLSVSKHSCKYRHIDHMSLLGISHKIEGMIMIFPLYQSFLNVTSYFKSHMMDFLSIFTVLPGGTLWNYCIWQQISMVGRVSIGQCCQHLCYHWGGFSSHSVQQRIHRGRILRWAKWVTCRCLLWQSHVVGWAFHLSISAKIMDEYHCSPCTS